MKRIFLAFSNTVAAILFAASSATATTVTFSAFPGPDNTLGTGDDVPINAGSGNGQAVFFTTEYTHLTGGAGLLVDSPVEGNPTFGYNSGLGAVLLWGGNNILVGARPDAGPGQFSFGPIRYHFVDSSNGTNPVAVVNVDLDFVSGIFGGSIDTAQFFDLNGTLLATATYTDGVGSNHVSYSNLAGIARVDIGTSFSVATDNFSYSGLVVPEPTVFLSSILGAAVLTLSRRRTQNSAE